MKKYAKRLKKYEASFGFDTETIVAEMNRLIGAKTVTVSIELEESLFLELKKVAVKRGFLTVS